MTKDEKQEEARVAWQQNKGIGTFLHPTGFGKTHQGCIIIEKVKQKNPNAVVLVLAPFTSLVKDWKDRIKKLVTIQTDITVHTVQYYVLNQLHLTCDLLIIDELDEFYSDERLSIIKKKTCSYRFCLALTATEQDKQRRHLVALLFVPVVHKISEEEAIENNWISDFIQYNLAVDLTVEEREHYNSYTKIIADCNGKFNSYDQALSVLTGDKDKNLSGFDLALRYAKTRGWKENLNLYNKDEQEINELWHPRKIIGYAKLLVEATRLRNNLLDLCESKYSTTLEIVDKFFKVKTIIFSQSINFVNKINLLLNEKYQIQDNLFDNNFSYCIAYHSELVSTQVYLPEKGKYVKLGVSKLKEYYLNCVKQGYSYCIASAKALIKGLDIKDMRLAINTSGDSTTNRQQQKEGRIKRLEEKPYEKLVIFVNLYVVDTKEERTLKERQRKSIQSKIKYINSVDEIILN